MTVNGKICKKNNEVLAIALIILGLSDAMKKKTDIYEKIWKMLADGDGWRCTRQYLLFWFFAIVTLNMTRRSSFTSNSKRRGEELLATASIYKMIFLCYNKHVDKIIIFISRVEFCALSAVWTGSCHTDEKPGIPVCGAGFASRCCIWAFISPLCGSGKLL